MSSLRAPCCGGSMASDGYLNGEVPGGGVAGAGGGGQAWGMQPNQRDSGAGWPYYNSGSPGWPDPRSSGSGSQEQAYSRYDPTYWNPASHTAAAYPGRYTSGTELQGHVPYGQQGTPSYLNGAHPSAYTCTAAGAGSQHYPGAYHPTNPFYNHGQQPQTSYQAQPTASHQCPGNGHVCASQMAQPSSGPYSGVTSPGSRVPSYQPYPVQETTAGIPSYPYREVNPSILPQTTYPGSHSRTPTEAAWAHSAGYGPSVSGMPQPQTAWPSAPPAPSTSYGNPFVAGPASSWPSGGVPQTAYYQKDNPYLSHPGMNQPTYFRSAEESVGTVPGVSHANPNQKTHYVNPPQLYKTEQNRDLSGEELSIGGNSGLMHLPASLRGHLGIQKIEQVLQRADALEKEVNSFTGRKMDKEYRCLEELLTKELLELDSVETDGHDVVRQLRKEAVRKIQWILEKLDMKGL